MKDYVVEGWMTDMQRHAVRDKLGELHRPTSLQQASDFLEEVFHSYPELVTENNDLKRFINIRNEITHGGIMGHPSQSAYDQVLHNERQRLRALLERVILAMLGERPNLMNFSWEHWKHGR